MDPTDATRVHSYSTRFPKSENPISEGGRWINGSAGGANILKGGHIRKRGRLWGDVQTLPGIAIGVDEPTTFGDPTAIVSGDWGPTQTATATVRIKKTPRDSCCREVELRLRTSISRFSITGYEAYCSVVPEKPYSSIARWNGPNGSYWNFESHPLSLYLVDGDVITATAKGTNPTVITLYRNGEQILQGIDTGAAGGGYGAYGPWTTGNPGIGFFNTSGVNWEDFGLSSFSATDDPAGAAAAEAAGKPH